MRALPLDQANDPLIVAGRDTCERIILASYQDSLAAALKFQQAVHAFVKAPSAELLDAAKAAWIAAREPYSQTEVYRFCGGPIDSAGGPEVLLNSWPVDEAYLDEIPATGVLSIIADAKRYPAIDKALIGRLNAAEGEKNITCGWHAIEFLLWGQDLDKEGPGRRPWTDFSTAKWADRRRDFLTAATDRLCDDLAPLVTTWTPGDAAHYHSRFHALPADDAVRTAVKGMVMLAVFELAGERLGVPLDNQSQEEEQSCFSDATHRDLIFNVQGIGNLWEGKYRRLDGATIQGQGLRDITEARDAALAATLTASVEDCVAKARALPTPFDRLIVASPDEPGPKAARALQAALEKLGQQLKEFAVRLGKPFDPAEFEG